MKEKKINRRESLKRGLLWGVGFGFIPWLAKANTCKLSPEQTEGPFYPEQDQEDTDTDLTQVRGRSERAIGTLIQVSGQVQDENCQSIAGALVEIWQANHYGRYNHRSDPNVAQPLDENFQYWGTATTDEEGRYTFKTIKPGSYPATSDWVRPPHIHWKVQKRGFRELTTQSYFADEVELNGSDRILNSLPVGDRESVIVTFTKNETGILEGAFNIHLKSV